MSDNKEKTRGQTIGDLFALGVMLVVLGGIALALGSCGGEDLIFPAELAPTPTGQNTATPLPTDTPEVL